MAPQASEFTERSLEGKWVRLEFEPQDEIDRYGRLLAYVFLEDGTFFNRELVRKGYARAHTRFDFRYKRDFLLARKKPERQDWDFGAEKEGRARLPFGWSEESWERKQCLRPQ